MQWRLVHCTILERNKEFGLDNIGTDGLSYTAPKAGILDLLIVSFVKNNRNSFQRAMVSLSDLNDLGLNLDIHLNFYSVISIQCGSVFDYVSFPSDYQDLFLGKTMYDKANKLLLVTTASAVPNNLAIQTLGKSSQSFAIGVIHGGYVNVVPIREGEIRSKYIPCVEPGTRPRHVTTTVTQVKWFCVQGTQILAITSTLGLHVYDDEGRKCLFTHSCSDSHGSTDSFARGLALVNGERLCVGNSSGSIRIFKIPSDVSDYLHLEKLSSHNKAITDIACNESQDIMVSADDSGCLLLWNVKDTIECITTITGRGFPCTSIQMWKSLILAAYGSGHIRMFDFKTSRLLTEVAAHARWITGIDLAPGRGLLLSVSEDSFAKIWTIDSEEKLILHKYTAAVENKMLVGGKFLNSYGTEFCVSAYDANDVICFSV
ncbi:WD repeat-containing protein 54 [Gryllus bimaculatus]|nr:WD repeat-containing protein 54 [Gryllus bimaculatus]